MTVPASTAATPKYLDVSESLEAEVQTGRWDGGKMPSVRWVARHYRVSAVTASRALQVLRDKGLVRTVERSGSFRQPPASADRWALVLRTTAGPWQADTRTLARAGFEAVARRRPMHLEPDLFPAGFAADDVPALTRQAKERGVRGVFLLPSRACAAEMATDEALLAACQAEGLAVVLLERNLRGDDRVLSADLVAVDDVAGAACATRHLLEGGRTRVAVVVASPTSSHYDRVAGYLVALHAAGPGFEPVVIRQPDGLAPEEAALKLADEVTARGLDGVVCYADYAAAGLIAELTARGRAVPRDVAVVGFDDLPAGSGAVGVTSYAYPAEAMAEQAVRLMAERLANPGRPAVKVQVPGRLVVRGSSAS
ncbi:HTH-type transcriptional regulator GalR [Urbifossiella limnaea]|uniref:HTH-type transcriptional regulator GalR n=1 Tax=Urbifossiella limnaea TaxID=2528023 RepID=A0A517XYQ3_9BACT|nr:HTH-type transcriptional regulator GalR [Urbifossiella limnaea]